MVPRLVEELKDNKARMQDGRWVKLDLVDRVKVGDFLLVQADLAIEKVSRKQVKLMKELVVE